MLAARLTLDNTAGRFILFGAIGLSGFIPNLAALAVLTSTLQVDYLVATVLATQVAIAWNFVLLENLAYRRLRSGSALRRLAEFVALNNTDLFVRIPLLAILVEVAHIGYLIATVVTLMTMFVLRFFITDRFVYRVRRRLTAGPVTLDFAQATGTPAVLAAEEA